MAKGQHPLEEITVAIDISSLVKCDRSRDNEQFTFQPC